MAEHYERSDRGGEGRDRGEGRDNREGRDGGKDGKGAGGKVFFRRRKTCPLSGPNAPVIDHKDVKLLRRFVSERGKMLPRRITSVCAKKQRELARAVKRARILALLPYVDNQ